MTSKRIRQRRVRERAHRVAVPSRAVRESKVVTVEKKKPRLNARRAAALTEPWPTRSLLVFGALALLLQPLAGVAFRQPGVPLGAALTAPDLLRILVSFAILSPLARRLTHAERRFAVLESLSIGLMTQIAYLLVAALLANIVAALVRHPVGLPVYAVSASALTVAFLGTPVLYGRFQRWLFNRATRAAESASE